MLRRRQGRLVRHLRQSVIERHQRVIPCIGDRFRTARVTASRHRTFGRHRTDRAGHRQNMQPMRAGQHDAVRVNRPHPEVPHDITRMHCLGCVPPLQNSAATIVSPHDCD